MRELLPGAARFAVLANPGETSAALLTKDAQTAAQSLGVQLEVVTAATNREIDLAIADVVQRHAAGFLVIPSALFTDRRLQLATAAKYHHLPAIYPGQEFAEVGGLMSYGSNLADQERQLGIYAGRILKGEKPADLPAMRATKFEFVINLQTASTFGLMIPLRCSPSRTE